jgi:hypothetical protein
MIEARMPSMLGSGLSGQAAAPAPRSLFSV